MEALVYSNIEFFYDETVAVVIITRKMMEESGAFEDDIDDISEVARGIEGIRVGITLRELDTGGDKGKASVRTVPGINSNEIAAEFGGGGHPSAAGFSFNASLDDIKKRLLDILPDFLPDS